jgi:hypothetical protein
MISDHFARAFMKTCDDGGIYYIRQLDASDGADFEGMVWFGQELVDRPGFANVFIGGLQHGAGTDDCGFRQDRWIGRYFDVPKGRACSSDRLAIETYLSGPVPDVAACDHGFQYLFRSGSSLFGGQAWGFDQEEGCYQACLASGCCTRVPPPVHPHIRSLRRDGPHDDLGGAVARLTSRPLPAGFLRSASGNLTGTWRGDDRGNYYINHVQATGEVVWYAEFDDAHPVDPSTTPATPANGWANVFWGSKAGSIISGRFADVPRGLANGAGPLELHVENNSLITITAPRGNYGGRRLWRVETLDVAVVVPRLNVQRAQEGLDEPLLYLFFYKFDGESVDLDDLTHSYVGGPDPQPHPILAGDDVSGVLDLPTYYTTYRTTLSTVRNIDRSETEVKRSTRIGVAAYAIEVDDGYSNEYRRDRFNGWKRAVNDGINRELSQNGVTPSIETIRALAQTMWVTYLGPWDGWPWGDPDDVLSGDVQEWSFAELEALALASATLGRIPLSTALSFGRAGTRYTCDVEFYASSRSNSDCR